MREFQERRQFTRDAMLVNALFGGIFSGRVDDGPWTPGKNAVTLEYLDAILTSFFTGVQQPAAFYLAPFTTNVAPSSALKASTFVATQGEYTGYTQSTRQVWTPNGGSVNQTVSNSNAAAVFTIGASAATIYGAALLTSPTKGDGTGILIAAGLFGSPNTLSPGSTLTVQYGQSGAPSS
jgi:hypothetical protein